MKGLAAGWWRVAAVGLLAGCASLERVDFDRQHLATVSWPGPRIEGRALVVMSAEEAGWVYEGPPAYSPDITPRWTRFEVGEITRQTALHLLGEAFAGGAAEPGAGKDAAGGTVRVTPKVDQFTYMPARRSLRAEPSLTMEMHVEFRSPDGRLLFESTRASGQVVGRPAGIWRRQKQNPLELRRLFHATVADLLTQAVLEYRATRRQPARRTAGRRPIFPGRGCDPRGRGRWR